MTSGSTDGGDGSPGDRPRRRPRYPGTHPRQYRDKYKELAADAHPEHAARVVAAGRTPAGSHRPIMVAEILGVLEPRPGCIAVDATLGHGGHALAILPLLRPGGRLVGLDVDPLELPRAEARIRSAGFGPDAFVAIHSNMAGLPKALAVLGLLQADIVVADLGCSSMQLDDPERGFSHKREGPLDLRMNPRRGQPASDLVAGLSEARLAEVLAANADEPRARDIAAAVIAARAATPITRTTQLAAIVRSALPPRADPAPTLARVFQALRIEVNDELSALQAFLRALPTCLAPGGRVAILTFHSGEDRRVKHALREGAAEGLWSEVARQPIRASAAEVRSNPRASSAKLRWARRSES